MISRYEVGDMPEPLPRDLVEALSGVELATIGHIRHRGFADRGIAPVHRRSGTIVGTAVTVSLPACDGAILHYALDRLRPGDFLMIDRLGDNRYACVGGGVAARIARTGAVGVAIDGPCTDLDELAEIDIGIWARGVTALTTRLSDLGGALNYPVAIGNVPVLPGDVVMADTSGLIVLPRDEAWAVCRAAINRERAMQAFQSAAPEERPPAPAIALVERALNGADHDA